MKKGETTVVEVTIVMSPERLEMLTEQDSNSKIININKISLIYGDEVSRVRVSRSVCQYLEQLILLCIYYSFLTIILI